MDTPPVRYATTSDGVSIAWAEAGQGRALLYCGPIPFTHVQEFWMIWEASFAALAGSFRLVTFDARGTGMSERDAGPVSADTLLLDAQAVIDAAQLDALVVLAGPNLLSASTCLAAATASPDRVTHVVLDSPFQNVRELGNTPFTRTNQALADLDWSVFTQTLLRVLLGPWDAAPEVVESFARSVEGWVTPAMGVQYVRTWNSVDISDVLPRVQQPTLVLRHEPYFVPAHLCQRVAARIPNAQFIQYSDPTYSVQAELIRDFIDRTSATESVAAAAALSTLRTVLFTDLVGHTEMMARLGDEKGRQVLREHERITREVLAANGGTEVKTMGDGFMASFGSVTKAVECAMALQRAFAEREGEPLSVRVGLNAGEPIEEDGDLFGATVILASRIAAKAEGGEILVANAVREISSGKGFLFADRGDFVAKGFEDPVRVYEVRWREDAPP